MRCLDSAVARTTACAGPPEEQGAGGRFGRLTAAVGAGELTQTELSEPGDPLSNEATWNQVASSTTDGVSPHATRRWSSAIVGTPMRRSASSPTGSKSTTVGMDCPTAQIVAARTAAATAMIPARASGPPKPAIWSPTRR